MSSEELMNQAIAYQLRSRFGDQFDYAWIFNQKNIGPHLSNRLYFSRFSPESCPVSSAVIKLVQGIFEKYRDQSFFLLRQKIFSTSVPTQLDRAVTDLAAKRVRHLLPSNFDINALSFSEVFFEEIGHSAKNLSVDLPKFLNFENQIGLKIESKLHLENLLFEIEKNVNRELRYHDSERPIAAILLDHENKIIQISQHLGVFNKTFHAEVLLCQKYYFEKQARFPNNSRLIVSLKPCRMCSQMISEMTRGLDFFTAVYKEDDPGSKAKNLSLENSHQLIPWQHFNL